MLVSGVSVEISDAEWRFWGGVFVLLLLSSGEVVSQLDAASFMGNT